MKRIIQDSPVIAQARIALPIAGRDHTQGPENAAIQLLEYGDYQCPWAQAAYPEVVALQRELGDKLQFAYRHFPLAFHDRAFPAAAAVEAATLEGKFWELHGELYGHPGQLSDAAIAERARALGLNVPRMTRQIASGLHAARVDADMDAGLRAGVNSTPTFFLNGALYTGEHDAGSMLRAATRATGVFVGA